jgi:hypothetical protein
MKKQFKLIPALGVEFSVVRKKNFSKTKVDAEDDFSKIDLFATKKQFSEIAKSFPHSPGVLIFSSKKQEILKVMICESDIKEQFLSLKEMKQFVRFLLLIQESGSNSLIVNYARDNRA